MRRDILTIWGLILIFAVMMSLPFLLPGCGFLALLGFVPLLCAERMLSLSGKRHIWAYILAAFLLWNAFTTFWVCNATVGGGIAAIVLNSLQMLAVFLVFRLSRRSFAGVLPYIMLAVTWIAWEKSYFGIDISWPWLTLGNAFAGTPWLVQWYDVTGTLGGSLWVWVCNLGVFGLMVALSEGGLTVRKTEGGRQRTVLTKAGIACIAGLAAIFCGPTVWSLCKWFQKEEPSDEFMEVLIAQPNIDPYHKFEALSQKQQNGVLESLIKPELDSYRQRMEKDSTGRGSACVPGMLILAPETFTSDVVTGELEKSPTLREFRQLLSEFPGVNMILGASTYTEILSKERPSLTSRPLGNGRWYESHNSALMLDGSGRTELFHKNKLVVAVEKLPYPEIFDPIDRMLGGVMGRCIGDGDINLLHYRAADRDGHLTKVPLGCAI